MEKYCRSGQLKYDTMTHAHCMLEPKATDTYLEYVIFIAFPQQQLRFLYIALLLILLLLFLST